MFTGMNQPKMSKEKRGALEVDTSSKNIRSDHKIRQWSEFLASYKNKSQLIKFISEEWRKEKTTEDHYYGIISSYSVEREDLQSTHEEADTRVLFNAANAASAGYQEVVISSEDTDVFVLCLAFSSFIPCSLYVKCGKKT